MVTEMFSLGMISFLEPSALFTLLLLPLIWWFLRLKPLVPIRISFPPVRFLSLLYKGEESSQISPLWLLWLRLLLLFALIMFCAHPIISANKPFPEIGPVYIIFDNDWTAAENWSVKKNFALRLLDKAEREGRNVVVVATAEALNSRFPFNIPNYMTINKVRDYLEHLEPRPWFNDRVRLIKNLLKNLIA